MSGKTRAPKTESQAVNTPTKAGATELSEAELEQVHGGGSGAPQDPLVVLGSKIEIGNAGSGEDTDSMFESEAAERLRNAAKRTRL